jgi:hypothetical protein
MVGQSSLLLLQKNQLLQGELPKNMYKINHALLLSSHNLTITIMFACL